MRLSLFFYTEYLFKYEKQNNHASFIYVSSEKCKKAKGKRQKAKGKKMKN
jgi:hypothetical protein